MKKLSVILIICVAVIVAGFSIAMWQIAEARADEVAQQAEEEALLAAQQQEELTIQSTFYSTYGNQVQINKIVKPEEIKIYGYVWSDDTNIHTSICVNGAWVEIARQALPQSITK